MIRLNERFKTSIELLVRAPHGQTIGYTSKGHKILPILDEAEGKALLDYGYSDYIDGVTLFAAHILDVYEKFKCSPEDLTMFYYYYDYLMGPDIDCETANLLGAIPFKLDGIVEEVQEYAPRLTIEEAHKIYTNKKNTYSGYNLLWSKLRSSSEVQDILNKSETTSNSELLIKLKDVEHAYRSMENSVSFKIGRCITWFPRKVRGGIDCIKEHGFLYTLKYLRRKVWYK